MAALRNMHRNVARSVRRDTTLGSLPASAALLARAADRHASASVRDARAASPEPTVRTARLSAGPCALPLRRHHRNAAALPTPPLLPSRASHGAEAFTVVYVTPIGHVQVPLAGSVHGARHSSAAQQRRRPSFFRSL